MVNLLRRRAMMVQKSGGGGGRLPAGYTEVEYLESTGTQYIITDIVPLDTRTDADFQKTGLISGTDEFIAAKIDTNQRYGTWFKAAGGSFCVIRCNGGAVQGSTSYDELRHVVIFNDASHGCWWDGTLKTTNSLYACTSSATPICLFARGKTSGGVVTGEKFSISRIYSIKFTDNPTGNILGEFVPCINPNSEAGMYDLITQRFYGNAGTGDFIAGNPV